MALELLNFLNTWEQRKLIDEIELFGGLTYSPKDVVPSPGSLVLRSSNVKDGEISLEDSVYVLKGKATSTPVQLNDIIVVVRNGSRSLIGKHAIVKTPLDNAVIGAFMTGIRTKQPDFISVLMDSQAFKKAITENLGATINQITGGMLKQMVFLMPTSETEKTAIGNFFRTLDDAISLHQKKLEHFKKLKESLLQNMFPREGEIFPRLRFPEFADAWEQRKLIDEIELFGGLTYSPKDVVPSPGSLVLRSSNVKDGEISLEDSVYVLKGKATSTPVQLNDIIVVVRNGSRSLIGKHAIVKTPLDNAVIGAFMTGIRTKQPDFISVLMDSQAFKKAITENLGATINQITGGMLKQMVFLMPTSETEKTAIGNFFRTLDDAISLHQRELPHH
ncbi:restriction endonuclease subunit S [Turicimonas muris]|uniref:restriction endonuclease subunit S n=1 Tax=Turicimonas muris TaxID=1796652 RepID=UPI0023F17272|nr:restriction endonuclease subunit S [Turicimonas muris]